MPRQQDKRAEHRRRFAESLYAALVNATEVTIHPRFWNPERVYPETFTEVMERVSPQEVRQWHVALPLDPQIAYQLAYDSDTSWLIVIQEDVTDIVRRIVDGMKAHFDRLPHKSWYDLIHSLDLRIDIVTDDAARDMRIYENMGIDKLGIDERIYDTRKTCTH